jgi:hypothetical protein
MRGLNLSYNPKNPRSVRGAQRRGWDVVKVQNNYVEETSWLGLCIWCDTRCKGYWVGSFSRREIAFENSSDATFFKLKWT